MNQDENFKITIMNNYELIKEKLKCKAMNHEILFTMLPYNMCGSTIYKKLNEKYNVKK